MPFARVDLLKSEPAEYRATLAELCTAGSLGSLTTPEGEPFVVAKTGRSARASPGSDGLGEMKTHDRAAAARHATRKFLPATTSSRRRGISDG
jgi:hypothetical protein